MDKNGAIKFTMDTYVTLLNIDMMLGWPGPAFNFPDFNFFAGVSVNK